MMHAERILGVTWASPPILVIIVSLTVADALGSVSGLVTVEVCRDGHFKPFCKHGEVILIESALYGRVRPGSCAKDNIGLGCSTDVKEYLASRCSGKQSCDVLVSRYGDYFKETQPCTTDFSWHLYLSYQCIPAYTSTEQTCINKKQDITDEETGYLSSHVARTSKYGAGTDRCPWRIQVKSGQKIQLSVYSFLIGDNCHNMYAKVIEKSQVTTIKLCQMESSVSVAYTSTGNVIDVYFINLHAKPPADYLLMYKATGCADVPAIPVGSHAKRSGNSLTVKCNATEEIWFLTCSDTKWKGALENCTLPYQAQGWGIFEGGDFPYGIVIVVAVGVALGILFGGTTLLFISYRMKRNSHRYEKPPDHCWNYETGTIRRNSGNRATGESPYTGTAPTHKQWPQGGAGGPNAATVVQDYTSQNPPPQQRDSKLESGNNNKKVLVMSDNKILDYTQSSPHLYESPQAEHTIDAFYG